MKLAKLVGSLLKEHEPATHHPDICISEFILKELLAFEAKVKEEQYYPPDSRWTTHEMFVKDLDTLIATFSLLRSKASDTTHIYDDPVVQKGLLLFISMYRNLCFLEIPEIANDLK